MKSTLSLSHRRLSKCKSEPRAPFFPKLSLKSSKLLPDHPLSPSNHLSPSLPLLLLLDESLAARWLVPDPLSRTTHRKLSNLFQLLSQLLNSLLLSLSSLVVVVQPNLPLPLLELLAKLARQTEPRPPQPLLPHPDALLRQGTELRLYLVSRTWNRWPLKLRNEEVLELQLPLRVNSPNRNRKKEELRDEAEEPVSEGFKQTMTTRMRKVAVTRTEKRSLHLRDVLVENLGLANFGNSSYNL